MIFQNISNKFNNKRQLKQLLQLLQTCIQMNDQITSFFIRPPRQTYYQHDLGPQMFPVYSKFSLKSHMGIRTDFSIVNNRNYKISASFYRPQRHTSQKCLIYLHTHHGSKLQATCLIQPMLNANINICLFDFCGYGNSEGDTVTLGIQQSQDIAIVIQQLKKKFEQQKFVLWGRSMGAVASLIYLSKQEQFENHQVVAAIFDSPFHSLYELALQIGSKNLGLPTTILRPFMYLIKKKLQDKINFQQLQLQPIVESIRTPGMFIASKQDKFVSHLHSQKLYNKYGGMKQLVYIQRDHNQPRKQQQLATVFPFIFKKLSIPIIKKEKEKQYNYLSIISNHYNFIDKYQNDSKRKQYFNRDWMIQQKPLTQRIQPIKNQSHNQNKLKRPLKIDLPIPQSSKSKTKPKITKVKKLLQSYLNQNK